MRESRPTPSEAPDWEAIFREHAPALRRFIRRRVPRSLVDDTLQDTYVRALRSADRFDPARAPLPWLITIAGRACCETLRVLPRELPSPTAGLTATATDVGPHENYERHLRRQAMALALGALSPRHRRLFCEWELKGEIDFDALALEEGITPQALKSVLNRARTTFRAAYATAARRTGAAAAVAWSRLARRDRMPRTTGWTVAGMPLLELAMGGMAAVMTATVILHGAATRGTTMSMTSTAVEQAAVAAGSGVPALAPSSTGDRTDAETATPPGATTPPSSGLPRPPVDAKAGVTVGVGPGDSAASVTVTLLDPTGPLDIWVGAEVRCDNKVRMAVCDAAQRTPFAH